MLSIREPPQTIWKLLRPDWGLPRIAAQGQAPGLDSTPPTILVPIGEVPHLVGLGVGL